MAGRILKWLGGVVALASVCALAAYFAAVGLDKADKTASVLGAFIALASLAMSAYGAFLDRPRSGGGTGGGQSVTDSTVGGRLTMVRNVQGSLRIGTGSAPPPGPAPAPPPGPASPPAPGGQSVSGSQISGDATLVDGVGGDAQVDT